MTQRSLIEDRLSRVRAVLFDLDGTLIDTVPHILASFRHATAEVLGAALPDDVLLMHVGVPLASQMRFFTEDEEVAEALLVAYRRYNHATHDEMARLYDGTAEALTALHGRGIPLGVVTSKSAYMAMRGIELFDLGRFFSVVVTADDVTAHKPDPYPVLHAAHLLGVAPEACLYVGDSPHDIQAGHDAGALTAAAPWGVARAERLLEAGPDLLLGDIRDVVSLMTGDGARFAVEGRSTSVAAEGD
ncbi:MAG: HAD family hydrolase [Coriobacteriia bacterium]